MDVYKRHAKDEIVKMMSEFEGNKFFSLDMIDFDVDNIHYFGKKGYTRYYPFYVNKRPYILRIFRTDEHHFQPDVEILYEGKMSSPAVTLQILDGVNCILKDCDMAPRAKYSQRLVESAS